MDSLLPELTLADVASLLEVDESTVRRWVRQDAIQGYKIAGRLRFRREHVASFVESQKTGHKSSRTEVRLRNLRPQCNHSNSPTR